MPTRRRSSLLGHIASLKPGSARWLLRFDREPALSGRTASDHASEKTGSGDVSDGHIPVDADHTLPTSLVPKTRLKR